MTRKAIILTVCLTVCTAANSAPIDLSHVAANADWVVHGDCERFRGSELGSAIERKATELGITEKLDDFAKIFFFHPINDVCDVTIYGRGRDQATSVILISGRFDAEKLLAMLRLNPQYGKEQCEHTVLHHWYDDKQGGKMMYGCFYRDNLVVMSSGQETARNAIAVLNGKAAGACREAFDQPAIADKGAMLIVAVRNVGAAADDGGSHPVFLSQMQSLSVSVGESGGQVYSDCVIQARSTQAAEGIAKMAEGMLALAAFSAEQRPLSSKIAEEAQVSLSDTSVHIRLQAAPQLVADMFEKKVRTKTQ